jgi:hypothetical protein
MDILVEVLPSESPASGGRFLDQLLKVSFFSAITVATIGWVSAFGWLIVKVAEWVIA